MNKEELIQHWMDIVSAVFHAEDNLKDEWIPRLKAAKKSSLEEKGELYEEYLRAIATEIVSKSYEHDRK